MKYLSLLLSLFVVSVDILKAQETTVVACPYDFPIKPGTQAWADLDGIAEKIAACELPISLAKNMTTKALLQTCLSYPLKSRVLVNSGSSELLDSIFNDFYGFKELASRSDVGICILDSYRLLSDNYSGNKVSILDAAFVHWLYTRKEIISKCTLAEKEQLALLSIGNGIRLRKSLYNSSASTYSLVYGLFLIDKHDVVIHCDGKTYDKNSLPVSCSSFINGNSNDAVSNNWIIDFVASIEPYVK